MSGRGEGAGASVPRRVVLDPAAIFVALGRAKIDYVLIGGLAVGAHGAGRATRDVDICPNPADDNLRRLARFLEEIGAVNRDAGEPTSDELPAHDFEGLRGGGNFRLRTRLGDLDVMQHVGPFEGDTWAALDKRAEKRHVFGQDLRVCDYETLIAMKQAAGRDQDRIDIANLKAARREL